MSGSPEPRRFPTGSWHFDADGCRRILRVSIAWILLATVAVLVPSPASAATPPIVIVFMENHNRASIVGNANAPYLNSLLSQGVNFTNYTEGSEGAAGPSLPDYLVIAAGSNCGRTTDTVQGGDPGISANCPNTVWNQLETAGHTWAVYQEGMSGPCSPAVSNTVNGEPGMAMKHDPARPFASIFTNQALCNTHSLPLSSFDRSSMPDVSFIAPTICNDMHGAVGIGTDCELGSQAVIMRGDDWLAANIQPIIDAGGRVFITFDEGGTLYAVLVGGLAPRTDSTLYTHCSTLAGIEDLFGLPRLGCAATAAPLPFAASAPPPAIFSDDFSSNDFSKWSGVTRLTIDAATFGVAPPSAKAQTTAQTAFAYKNLSGTLSTICMSASVNATSRDAVSTTLLRLRTAANGPILRVFANSNGILYVRSDASNMQLYSGVALGTGWHNIELCGTVGVSGTWDLYRDGVKRVNAWVANTGTTPVGRVDIGNTQAVTATINFDDIVVDQPQSTDTDPPTAPGKPTGSSPSAGTIAINWAASTDASPPITYRIYRDGNPTAIGTTTSTSFTDTGPGLTPGSSHTYTVDAIDSLNNGPSQVSPTSDPITVVTVDTDPPTAPGKPTGSSPSVGTIAINWAASTDASPPITYRIYRDGNPTAIGSTTSTSFTDNASGILIAGSSHTYTVDAIDSLNNGPSQMSPTSDPITVASASAIFSDDFSSNDFSNWTGFTRLTIDAGTFGVAPPSAKAQTTAQTAFAYKNLSGTFSTICMSANVNATSLDPTSSTLLRLRTAGNGPIVRVFANSNGILYVRSDASNTQIYSGAALGSGWHNIELCGTVGVSGTWDLYRDGVKRVNAWVANTGTTPVGRVDIGNTQAVTARVNFDDIVVDQTPG